MANYLPITIPKQSDKMWTQLNTGEILGSLWSTKNINFNQKGYAKLAQRTTALLYNASNIKNITAMGTLDGLNFYQMSSFSGSTPGQFDLSGGVSSMISGANGSSKFDGLVWQGRWYVSQDTTFQYFSGSLWTTGLGLLTTGKYHPLCVHEGLNQLAIGDGNLVKLYDTSHSLITTITLTSDYEVLWICYNNNSLYIGTRNIKFGDSTIFIASGAISSADYQVKVPSSYYAFSGCIYQGVLVIIVSSGQLLRFNAQGFEEIAHLPVFDTPYTWFNGQGYDTGKVAQRGMIAKGDRIYLNLDGYLQSPNYIQLPNQPSGLWCYDPKVGLYHVAGLSNEAIITPSFVSGNSTTGVITTSAFASNVGTRILIFSTDIGGLTSLTLYYIIPYTTTTFRLATTYTNAINGIYVPLTSNGTQLSMFVHADSCFGETKQGSYQPGALMIVPEVNSTVNTYLNYISSQFIFGASQVNATTGAGVFTLQTLTIGENRGTITTTKIQSSQIQDTWNALFSKYDNLFEANDKIVVKYRQTSKEYYPIIINSQCTCVTSTSFTSSSSNWINASIGDEIEITSGRGAGCTAHIVSTTNNSGTWTIVIDEAIPGVLVSDVSNFMIVQNFTKIDTITSTDDTFKRSSISKQSKWIQFKIELRGVSEPYIEELQIANKPYQPTE